MPQLNGCWCCRPMAQLHLHVAYGPQPQHLLGAGPRRKVMVAQAEAAAVDADTLADASVRVDGEVNNLYHAGVILVGCKPGRAVTVRMQLPIYKGHTLIVIQQHVTSQESCCCPACPWQWIDSQIERRAKRLRQHPKSTRDVSDPACSFCVRLLAICREEVRQAMVEYGNLEQTKGWLRPVGLHGVEATSLNQREWRPGHAGCSSTIGGVSDGESIGVN
mmetsp:Transcript_7889/g.14685  ORF Transcript_7889/g.14685 Transcript_7889/m.14685 type:complete len:219 (+) Transcript_7889:291-947(+)